MTLPVLFVLGLVLVASLLLVSERLRPDLVALAILVVLGLTGLVPAADLFSGFSRPAVITIMSLFIITAALERTGATRVLGQWLGRLAGRSEARAALVVMLATASLSLVMNTIAAAAVLLPAVIGLARQADLRPSRLLMPLAFGSLLGGMATIFTTANILVSSALVDAGLAPYSVLDFIPVGLPMALAGIFFVAFYGRRLLPEQEIGGSRSPRRPGTLSEAYGMTQAVSACYVKPGSAMAGLSLAEGQWGERLGLNVLGISRGGSVNLAPRPNDEVLEGDLVLFTGETDDEELGPLGLKLTADPAWSGQLASDQISLVEVVIAPRSSFAGATLREAHFRETYDLRVLAIWREGQTLRESLAEIPLRFGDALLLQGRRSKIALLRDDPGLIVLEEDTGPVHVSRRALVAVALTTAAVVLAASNLLPLNEAVFSAAVLMLLAGCLDMNDAYRSIEWRTVFLIAGMLPLALALSSTGAAALVGDGLIAALGALGPLAVAGGLFWASTLLTQIVSAQVTPLVLAPIAIAAAQRLGADARGLALAVALGASTTLLTPIAHPSNLLVMGPGGYKFKDYARVGLPLTLLLFVVMLVGLAVFSGYPLTVAVPLLDLTPLHTGDDPAPLVAAVRAACEQIGFLTITGHGVPEAVTRQASDAARAFFDLPRAEKERLPLTPHGAGYSPLKGESLARTLGQATPADLKESFNVGSEVDAVPWPARPAELRAALTGYLAAMEQLAADMLRLFALALDLPPAYFAERVLPSNSFLRVINYPPPEAAPEPGQLRAGAHTDYGILTILRSENVAGGLQVRTRAGEWLGVPVPEGALVINLGDMMKRWTNDRWLSTLHRVVNPPAAAWTRSRRQSLAFFYNPNPAVVIECLPGCCDSAHPAHYPPIRAGDFIAEKSRQAYGG